MSAAAVVVAAVVVAAVNDYHKHQSRTVGCCGTMQGPKMEKKEHRMAVREVSMRALLLMLLHRYKFCLSL